MRIPASNARKEFPNQAIAGSLQYLTFRKPDTEAPVGLLEIIGEVLSEIPQKIYKQLIISKTTSCALIPEH